MQPSFSGYVRHGLEVELVFWLEPVLFSSFHTAGANMLVLVSKACDVSWATDQVVKNLAYCKQSKTGARGTRL